MRTLNNISRFIVGIVFVFSGFVKAIDPLGSAYKFKDYFEAFGMESLSFIALPLAILLSSVEFVIGFSLLFATRKKLTSWVLLIFMGFFTVLTFILALSNPVTDCGCFGDAIIMTNWQTFWKNVFLMIFTLVIFFNREKYEARWRTNTQWTVLAVTFVFSLFLSLYSYNNLPILDFRPYKVGTYIPEKMIIPQDAPTAEYETILIYTKDGVEKEFTLENLPDSTWEWVSTENNLISEGYIPPIHDFTISTLGGNDITEIILNDKKFTFLLVAYDLKEASTKNIDQINKLAEFAMEYSNSNFICLTASVESEIEEFRDKTDAPYAFFNTDEITLKTIIRSNPGIVLLKSGIILDKWHHSNIPSLEEIEEDYLKNPDFKNISNNREEVFAALN